MGRCTCRRDITDVVLLKTMFNTKQSIQIERVCRLQFQNGRKFSKRIGDTVGKGEIARYEQFLLFPQRFQNNCTADTFFFKSLNKKRNSSFFRCPSEIRLLEKGKCRLQIFSNLSTIIVSFILAQILGKMSVTNILQFIYNSCFYYFSTNSIVSTAYFFTCIFFQYVQQYKSARLSSSYLSMCNP